jgi:hypothetical protein
MVGITSLWLPILLSAVVVFAASWVIHVFLPYHRTDFRQIPAEDQVMESLRRTPIPPGDYIIPHASSPAQMKDPEFIAKRTKGPIAFMTVMKGGPPTMGAELGQWFVYCLVISVFAAYIAGRALGPGSEYAAVFRFVGVSAFLGYAAALWQNSIWFKRGWGFTVKSTFDGLVYALLTAGIFGWLWPN